MADSSHFPPGGLAPGERIRSPGGDQAFDVAGFRAALGRFPTGVAVVSIRDKSGQPRGLTVNSFGSVSLEPPLVLWSLREQSSLMSSFEACTVFAVNVLAEDQAEVARIFASAKERPFDEARWSLSGCGCPTLDGTAAIFVCRNTKQIPAGDHRIFIGEVTRYSSRDVAPLVFAGGMFRSL